MFVDVSKGKNHLFFSIGSDFASNKKCLRKKSKFYVHAIPKTSLEQRHCTAANAAKMKFEIHVWDALHLHVLLINRFFGVFLSSFCFHFLFFFLVAVFNFLSYAYVMALCSCASRTKTKANAIALFVCSNFQLVIFDYGMGNNNPMDEVWFYGKYTPKKAEKRPRDEASND